jgi:hypothetical protein
MGPVRFKSHYKVDPLLELDNLKDNVDSSSRIIDFMIHKLGSTFVMFLTTNLLSEDQDIYSLLY